MLDVTSGEQGEELSPSLETEIVNGDFDKHAEPRPWRHDLPTLTDESLLVSVAPGQFGLPARELFSAPNACSDYHATVSFRLLFEPGEVSKAEFPEVAGITMVSSRDPVLVDLWQDWSIEVSWLYVVQ